FYVGKWYYDPNLCLFNGNVYNEAFVFYVDVYIYYRNIYLCIFFKLSNVNGRENCSSCRCWYYYAFNDDYFHAHLLSRKKGICHGDGWTCYFFCSSTRSFFIWMVN